MLASHNKSVLRFAEGFCRTDVGCYAAVTLDDYGYDHLEKGCLSTEDQRYMNCKTAGKDIMSIQCCNTEACNVDISPTYAPSLDGKNPIVMVMIDCGLSEMGGGGVAS